MPQIPIYNRGLGPTVEMAAGQLAPRLQSGVFEQAALTPFETAQDVLGKVSEVASAFEKKRQEVELNRFEQQYNQTIDNMAMEFVTSDVSRTLTEFDSKASGYFQKELNKIDGIKNLPSSVKAKLKSQLTARVDYRVADGRKNAFSRQIEDDSKLYEDRLISLFRDWSDAEGQTVGPGLSKQDIIMEDMLEVVRQAQEIGLPMSATKEDLVLFAEAERINQLIILDNKSYDDVVALYDAIRLGSTSRYETMTLEERAKLAAPLESYINKLETSESVKATTMGDNAIASMVLDINNSEQHKQDGMVAADRLDMLGRPTQAQTLRNKLEAAQTQLDAALTLAFASPQEIAAYRKKLSDEADEALRTGVGADMAVLRRDSFNKVVDGQVAAKAEDIGGYVVDTYKMLNNGQAPTRSEIIKMQNQMGIPLFQMKPYTNTEAKTLKETLPDLDAAQRLQATQEFMSQFQGETVTFENGETLDIYNLAMTNGINDGLITSAMNVAMHVGGSSALDVLNAEGIDENSLDLAREEKSEINNSVTDEMKDFFASYIGSESINGILSRSATDSRVNSMLGIRDAIVKLAKVKVALNDMSPSAAAEEAASIILKSYDFVEQNGKVVRIPRRIQVADRDGSKTGSDIAMEVLNQRLTVDFIAERLYIPPSNFGYAGTREEAARLYAQMIVDDGGWRTNTDDTGVILVDKYDNEVMFNRNAFGDEVDGGTRFEFNFQDALDVRKAEKRLEAQAAQDIIDINMQINKIDLDVREGRMTVANGVNAKQTLVRDLKVLQNMQGGAIPPYPTQDITGFIEEYFPD